MDKQRLKVLLDAEVAVWSEKPYARLVRELPDVVAYQRGAGPEFHQFEVQMIECKPEYVHILVSIDDGSLLKSFSPLSHSFIVHRDGRIDR